jgi:FkbM family methyltransferase
VAIDIGANIGTHALYFSMLVDRVLAFEPNPPLALVCRANGLAAARGNIEIFDIALSDHNGTELLFVYAMDYGGASLDRVYPDTSSVSVAVKRADDFIQPLIKENERVVLIKIDVEGHEPRTLNGIPNIVSRHRPVVIFESASRTHLLSCIKILESVGYVRFDAVQKSWDENSGLSKLLALALGKTEVSVLPINHSKNIFYSAIVARP